MDAPADLDRRIASIAALDQPIRRDLYRLLSAADGWSTRDEAAAALGVPRSVAAFHLDKLVEAGVLAVRFERTSGRTGPGAGRPSKLYRPSSDEVAASVPDRHYDLAGSVLAAAVDDATRTGVPVAACLRDTARRVGRQIGEDAHDAMADDGEARHAITAALEPYGYEPDLSSPDDIVLRNCPFHRLADEHRELVCGMNLDLLVGLLEGLDPPASFTARLDPAPGQCCVRIAG